MNVDLSKHTVILFVDVSGSMYGQKIEAVNAAIAECVEVIRNHNINNSIQIGYAAFDDKWRDFMIKEDVGSINYKICPNADGFYNLTYFQRLYEGIEKCLSVFNNAKTKLCLLLITDGKPADSGEYTEVLERVKSMDSFRRAERYVALVGNDTNGRDNDVLEFVGFKADKIVKLHEVADTLRKVSFLSGISSSDNLMDAKRYNTIFGD